jgi:hypothetical protein
MNMRRAAAIIFGVFFFGAVLTTGKIQYVHASQAEGAGSAPPETVGETRADHSGAPDDEYYLRDEYYFSDEYYLYNIRHIFPAHLTLSTQCTDNTTVYYAASPVHAAEIRLYKDGKKRFHYKWPATSLKPASVYCLEQGIFFAGPEGEFSGLTTRQGEPVLTFYFDIGGTRDIPSVSDGKVTISGRKTDWSKTMQDTLPARYTFTRPFALAAKGRNLGAVEKDLRWPTFRQYVTVGCRGNVRYLQEQNPGIPLTAASTCREGRAYYTLLAYGSPDLGHTVAVTDGNDASVDNIEDAVYLPMPYSVTTISCGEDNAVYLFGTEDGRQAVFEARPETSKDFAVSGLELLHSHQAVFEAEPEKSEDSAADPENGGTVSEGTRLYYSASKKYRVFFARKNPEEIPFTPHISRNAQFSVKNLQME